MAEKFIILAVVALLALLLLWMIARLPIGSVEKISRVSRQSRSYGPTGVLPVPKEIMDAEIPRFGELTVMVLGDRKKAQRLVDLELARGAPGKAAAVTWAIERLQRDRR